MKVQVQFHIDIDSVAFITQCELKDLILMINTLIILLVELRAALPVANVNIIALALTSTT